jgi:imidazoleglycerol-phosphate dehydratase
LETDVSVQLDIDAWRFSGAEADFEPVGLGFFGHMLRTLTVYAGWSLHLDYSFDGHVDLHHGVEDIGIVLGQALAECLYESAEHRRFGSALAPMDDSLAEAVVDAGKRPYLHFAVDWPQPTIGSFDLCLTEEFFRALALNAGLTLHLSGRYGRNSHHLCEALFKAVGLALREALSPGAIKGPFSIKGVL